MFRKCVLAIALAVMSFGAVGEVEAGHPRYHGHGGYYGGGPRYSSGYRGHGGYYRPSRSYYGPSYSPYYGGYGGGYGYGGPSYYGGSGVGISIRF
jgi:hypothetical protein